MSKKEKKLRVFHGTVNVAGIAGEIIDFLRSNRHESDLIVYRKSKIHNAGQIDVKGNLSNVIFFLFKAPLLLIKCLFKYDIFHFYFGETILPFGLDLPILKLFGKKVVMTYNGTDVRLIDKVEAKRNPYFHLLRENLGNKKIGFFDKFKGFLKFKYDHPYFDNRKIVMLRWHNKWVDKFFAARDLCKSVMLEIPREKIVTDLWIYNLSIGTLPEGYLNKEVALKTKCPTVIHAPTNREIKGSKYVEKAIANLKEKGVEFEYKVIEGIDNKEVQRIMKEDADIVVDQLLLGAFGSLVVEAMYHGKPSVVYLIEEIKEEHFPDIPVANATIDTIEEVLEELIRNYELRKEMSLESKRFICKYFDKTKILTGVMDLYKELLNDTKMKEFGNNR